MITVNVLAQTLALISRWAPCVIQLRVSEPGDRNLFVELAAEVALNDEASRLRQH